MKSIGVIPARWASTRFPGKVLADLKGRPMIYYVWNQAKKASLDEVIIACDEEQVLKACQGFGAKAMMTSKDHASGTDRIAEAVKDIDAEIVVNIQGDEPLISPKVIDDLYSALAEAENCPMATVIKRIDCQEDVENPNIVKAIVDHEGFALYFSRFGIPFNREKARFEDLDYFKHLGIYAYRKDFLIRFKDLPSSKLEQIEKLEQLRVLEPGYRIKTIQTSFETIGVDTPEDLERVARQMSL